MPYPDDNWLLRALDSTVRNAASTVNNAFINRVGQSVHKLNKKKGASNKEKGAKRKNSQQYSWSSLNNSGVDLGLHPDYANYNPSSTERMYNEYQDFNQRYKDRPLGSYKEFSDSPSWFPLLNLREKLEERYPDVIYYNEGRNEGYKRQRDKEKYPNRMTYSSRGSMGSSEYMNSLSSEGRDLMDYYNSYLFGNSNLTETEKADLEVLNNLIKDKGEQDWNSLVHDFNIDREIYDLNKGVNSKRRATDRINGMQSARTAGLYQGIQDRWDEGELGRTLDSTAKTMMMLTPQGAVGNFAVNPTVGNGIYAALGLAGMGYLGKASMAAPAWRTVAVDNAANALVQSGKLAEANKVYKVAEATYKANQANRAALTAMNAYYSPAITGIANALRTSPYAVQATGKMLGDLGLWTVGSEAFNYGVNKLTPYNTWGELVEGNIGMPAFAAEFTNPGGFGLAGGAPSLMRNITKAPQALQKAASWRPWVPKNPNRYYRIVGEYGDPIGDAYRSGVIRGPGANPNFQLPTINSVDALNNPDAFSGVMLRGYDYPMFSKGKPWEGSTGNMSKGKPTIIRSKADTGLTTWEESGKDFGHKGHEGIYRPNYLGNVNGTPSYFFEYYTPAKYWGYYKNNFEDNGFNLKGFVRKAKKKITTPFTLKDRINNYYNRTDYSPDQEIKEVRDAFNRDVAGPTAQYYTDEVANSLNNVQYVLESEYGVTPFTNGRLTLNLDSPMSSYAWPKYGTEESVSGTLPKKSNREYEIALNPDNLGSVLSNAAASSRFYTYGAPHTYSSTTYGKDLTKITPVFKNTGNTSTAGSMEELSKTIGENIKYVQSNIPGFKPYGSAVGVRDGALIHEPGDIDGYVTQSQFDRFVKEHPEAKVTKKNDDGTYVWHINDSWGDKGHVDLNIVSVDSNGIGNKRAMQLYQQFFPDEYHNTVLQLSTRPELTADKDFEKYFPILDMNGNPMTAEQLLDRFDSSVGTILDSWMIDFHAPGKGKHASRSLRYLTEERPDLVAKALRQYADMVAGGYGRGRLFPHLKFGNKEENIQILKELNFQGDVQAAAESPERMQNILDAWYLGEGGTFYRASAAGEHGGGHYANIDKIRRNFSVWWFDGSGGNASGWGQNWTAGGASGAGRDLIGMLQPEIKGLYEGMNASDAIKACKRAMLHPDYKLTAADVNIINSTYEKWGLPYRVKEGMSGPEFLEKNVNGKTIYEANKEIAAKMGINFHTGDPYGVHGSSFDSYYAGSMRDFDLGLDDTFFGTDVLGLRRLDGPGQGPIAPSWRGRMAISSNPFTQYPRIKIFGDTSYFDEMMRRFRERGKIYDDELNKVRKKVHVIQDKYDKLWHRRFENTPIRKAEENRENNRVLKERAVGYGIPSLLFGTIGTMVGHAVNANKELERFNNEFYSYSELNDSTNLTEEQRDDLWVLLSEDKRKWNKYKEGKISVEDILQSPEYKEIYGKYHKYYE